MAPIAVVNAQPHPTDTVKAELASLSLGGVGSSDLRKFASFDNTPSIGTEFPAYSEGGTPTIAIRDILADEGKLKALAKLVSERGVVFFRKAEITPEEQKTLVSELGRLSGKPETSGLHIHPLTLQGTPFGDEISTITNQYILTDKFDRSQSTRYAKRRLGKNGWHTDITFENVPSDYASLQIRELPSVGGDTLWASAYEAYDRLSPVYQQLLEGLEAVHIGDAFLEISAKTGIELRDNRGAPENIGLDLVTTHPIIRTNPVTGWKGLFVNRGFTRRIVGLTDTESDSLLDFLFEHVSANHDLQVRFRWEKDSLAIWDNRSTFHTATEDIERGSVRLGTRAVSLGERPFLDPKSRSRRQALGLSKVNAVIESPTTKQAV